MVVEVVDAEDDIRCLKYVEERFLYIAIYNDQFYRKFVVSLHFYGYKRRVCATLSTIQAFITCTHGDAKLVRKTCNFEEKKQPGKVH